MRSKYPLISCICVTNNRLELLDRAIRCYVNQNYPNKELIISYPKKDQKTKSALEVLPMSAELNIIKMERDDDESVGNARNLAISKCKGDYICVWDDDDWYHPSRLTFQYNSMQTIGKGYNASILMHLLLYNSVTQKAYLSFQYTWENSILCRKEIILQNQYAHRNKGEDTHIIAFLEGKKLLHHIDDAPFLYVYIYHGENTWNYEHFENFIKKSQLLPKETTETIRKAIG